MEDTDWRPSACPECGRLRNAARYPVCDNYLCSEYGRGGPDKVERTMTSKENKRYVWIRENGDATTTSDPVKVWQDPNFDRVKDRIFQLGAEVEVQVTVQVKNKTVYRERSYAEGTR